MYTVRKSLKDAGRRLILAETGAWSGVEEGAGRQGADHPESMEA
jgi:hypothetical protein